MEDELALQVGAAFAQIEQGEAFAATDVDHEGAGRGVSGLEDLGEGEKGHDGVEGLEEREAADEGLHAARRRGENLPKGFAGHANDP